MTLIFAHVESTHQKVIFLYSFFNPVEAKGGEERRNGKEGEGGMLMFRFDLIVLR